MSSPPTVTVRPYQASDRDVLVALWTECGLLRPWNDPDGDIAHKQCHSPEGFLVLARGAELIGSVMIGYDGHRGWVNYLAVHPAQQGNGFGRLLMEEAEGRLAVLGCPKVNLQVRGANTGAVGFYRHLGYEVDDVVSMGKRLP